MDNLIELLLKHPNNIYCHTIMDNENTGFLLAWHSIERKLIEKSELWLVSPDAICTQFGDTIEKEGRRFKYKKGEDRRIEYKKGWITTAFNPCNQEGMPQTHRTPRWTHPGETTLYAAFEDIMRECATNAVYSRPTINTGRNYSSSLPLDLRMKLPEDFINDLAGPANFTTKAKAYSFVKKRTSTRR